MKVLLSLKTNKQYYYNENGDYDCKEGHLKEKDLKSGKSQIKSNKGAEFLVFESNNYDLRNKIKRGPQILIAKDLGYICSRTGITKNFTILEAGGGSGGATTFFASIAKKVVTYEIREEHAEIIKKNVNFLELKNADIRIGDLSLEIEKLRKNSFDLIFLDMPEPQTVLEKDLTCLKNGSYICCYLPSISQIAVLDKFIYENKKESLFIEEITEVGLRHWKITDRISRPEHQKEIDHTAFLVFIRKIQ
jgi:tRNA (adenine57-N1/adenine58-N1)-methyltransferase